MNMKQCSSLPNLSMCDACILFASQPIRQVGDQGTAKGVFMQHLLSRTCILLHSNWSFSAEYVSSLWNSGLLPVCCMGNQQSCILSTVSGASWRMQHPMLSYCLLDADMYAASH
jgi:hypothetical protein